MRAHEPNRLYGPGQHGSLGEEPLGAEMTIDKKPLTPTQRKILFLMKLHGRVVFYQGQRRFWWRKHAEASLAIAAYQGPEFFLKGRGLIERINKEGFPVYALTPAGQERANRIKEMPR